MDKLKRQDQKTKGTSFKKIKEQAKGQDKKKLKGQDQKS